MDGQECTLTSQLEGIRSHVGVGASDAPAAAALSPAPAAAGLLFGYENMNNKHSIPDAAEDSGSISDLADGNGNETGFDLETKGSTVSYANTDESAVVGLRFVGSTVCSSTVNSASRPKSPTSQQSSPLSTSPNTGSACRQGTFSFVTEDKDLIPPPPPEESNQPKENKGLQFKAKLALEDDSSAHDEQSTPQSATKKTLPNDTTSPKSHRPLDSFTYKIHLHKSPPKKNPHSIIEECDKRMAEKIALASSKASCKFEEKYSQRHHNSLYYSEKQLQRKQLQPNHVRQYSSDSFLGSPAKVANGNSESRYFCSGDEVVTPLISGTLASGSSSTGNSPNNNLMPHNLVRGAFSPWKIPDRADDEHSGTNSSIESSAKNQRLNESLVNSSGAATHATCESETLNESFEVNLDDNCVASQDDVNEKDQQSGDLTQVLQWLFSQVLSSSSPIATAFSAFEIHTSTTVQADRIRAIVKDSHSLNIICAYVAQCVTKRCDDDENKRKIDSQPLHTDITDDHSDFSHEPLQITKSTLSRSKSTGKIFKEKEKASIVPFEVPTSEDDGTNAFVRHPSANTLAANFVRFLNQISIGELNVYMSQTMISKFPEFASPHCLSRHRRLIFPTQLLNYHRRMVRKIHFQRHPRP